MGRVTNPDYFKVGAGTAGSGASAGGRFAKDRARWNVEKARLRHEGPGVRFPRIEVKPKEPVPSVAELRDRAAALRPAMPSAIPPAVERWIDAAVTLGRVSTVLVRGALRLPGRVTSRVVAIARK